MKAWLALLALLLSSPQEGPEKIVLVPESGVAVADGASALKLHLFIVDAGGKGVAGLAPSIRASAGAIAAIRDLGNGRYGSEIVLPEGAAAETLLEAFVQSGRETLSSKARVKNIAGATLTVAPRTIDVAKATGARVTIRAPYAAERLVLQTNVGSFGPLAGTAPDYLAEFAAPKGGQPMVAVFALVDRETGATLARATLPMTGSRSFSFKSEPGATVKASLGKRDLGPIDVDAEGRFTVRVEVNPGESFDDLVIVVKDPAENETRKVIPLEIDHRDSIQVSAQPSVIAAGSFTRIGVVLFDKAGKPLTGATVKLTAETGALGAVEELGGGRYGALFTGPATPGPVRVTAEAARMTATAVVTVVAGLPASIDFTSDKQKLIADGASEATLAVTVRDGAGNVLKGARPALSAPQGTLGAPSEGTDGRSTAIYTAPKLIDGGKVTITARVGLPQEPRGVTSLHLAAGAEGVVAFARDASGLPVPGAHVSFGGLGEAVTGLGGVARLKLAEEFVRVEARVGGVSTSLLVVRGMASPESALLARDPAPSIEKAVTIELLPMEITGAFITIAASPSSLKADGVATSTLTVRVWGTGGKPATGQLVTVKPTLGKTGPVSEKGAGVYESIYTAPLSGTATSDSVTASSGGLTSDPATITLSPVGGPASIVLVAQPSTQIADPSKTVVLTATVKDAEGKTVEDGTAVAISLGTSTSNGVTTGGNATATFNAPSVPGVLTGRATSGSATTTIDVTFVPGPPATLTLTANPTTAVADPANTITLEALVVDAQGNLVADGTNVTFLFTGSTHAATTVAGKATTTYPAPSLVGDYVAKADAGPATDSKTLTFTPGPPATIELTVNPATIPVLGQSTVTAIVKDAFGNLVVDGTALALSAISGTVPPSVTTTGGSAQFQFLAGTSTGAGSVTAQSGAAADTKPIMIVAGAPTLLELLVTPDQIANLPTATAIVEAKVQDAFGNLVSGERVDFTVSGGGGTLAPTFAFTNGIGIAKVTYTGNTSAGTFTLTGISQTAPAVQDTATIQHVAPVMTVTVGSGTEAAPGTINSVTLTVEIRDGLGALITSHPSYTATIVLNGAATTLSSVAIPDGSSGTTIVIDDVLAESVTVALVETSATPITEVAGSATFIAGPAAQVRILSAVEPPPGSANSVVVTVRVEDADGNPVSSHAAYGGVVTAGGSASVVGGTILIPDGTASVTVTVNDNVAEVVALTLTETSSTTLGEVNGTATFVAGPGAVVRVLSGVEPAPGSVNSVVLTIQVEDVDGNPVTSHPAYTATVGVTGAASVVGSPISIPDGTGTTTITVNDTAAEVVSVTLTETSSTSMAEVSGTATFTAGPATTVRVISAVEPAPGSANSVVVTIRVEDADGNPVSSHPAYTATVGVTGAASVVGSPISIPDGASTTTVTINDLLAEIVTVTLTETSATSLAEINGTATFIAGLATIVRVVSATEPAPGTVNSVILTIRVEDANGNLQTSHAAYTASVGVTGAASVVGSPISLPDGTASTTVTILDTAVEVVSVTLTETSATALTEVNGTATFTAGPATTVRVVSAVEPAPGTANSVVVTIRVEDADGNLVSSHAGYTATVGVTGSASVVGSPIALPDGTSSTTITVNDTAAEVVSVSLTETSATSLAEVGGTVTFVAGPAAQVRVVSGTEPVPGTVNSIVITIQVEDANGNVVASHPAYTATVAVGGSATISGSPISLPNGTASTTVTVNDVFGEVVTVTLTETSGTALVEINGTATFIGPTPILNAVVISATEAAPGSSNSIVLTIELQDGGGLPVTVHPAYTATVAVDGSASILGTPISIPDGVASVTVTVTDNVAEVVNVTLTETSSTAATEVPGTATFIPGPATTVRVVSVVEPSPGTVNSVVVTIRVEDIDGNLQPSHSAYAAAVGVSGAAAVIGSPISLPNGTASTTVTVTDATVEVVAVTLSETSGTSLVEINGTATFIAGPATQVVVVSATEAAPGNANSVVVTIEVRDANGNVQPSHAGYSATVGVSGAAGVSGSPIALPDGTGSTTITVTDLIAEVVTVTLTETSSTTLTEVNGTVTFIAGPATTVRVVSAVEPAPGTANSVVVTIRVEDADGNLQPVHPAYSATVGVTGAASVVGSPISLASGVSTTTVTINDAVDEIVSVTLTETSGTTLAEINGTVTFIAGPAITVRVVSDVEPAPGTANSLVLTIRVEDANGNLQPSHAAYTATVGVTGSAGLSGSPISLPNGTASTTVTVTDAAAEVVAVTLTETSGTTLSEINGTATFIAGPATQVVVISAVEPAPGTANSVTITIEVRDADGNVQPVHPAYTASVGVNGSAAVLPTSISLPSGTGSTTVTVTDVVGEVVNVVLTETSATSLLEVNGTATFIVGPATVVRVVSATEPAPGTANSVVVTIRVEDADGNLQPSHAAYTATVGVTGAAGIAGSPISLPSGTASTTVTVTDTLVEVVNVTLTETSGTTLLEINGTVTFIAGTAVVVRVVSATEPLPGDANSVVVTIRVEDADGNLQPTHAAYTATIGVSGSASVVGSPISIPSGTGSVTVTVNDAAAEVVSVTLTETSGTTLSEVNGTVTFLAAPATQVVVVSTSEPAPGDANSVVVTIEVRDALGNVQPNHPAYTATVAVSGAAGIVGSPISIPNGVGSTTVTVSDVLAEIVNVALTETSSSGLAEVNGTVTFIAGKAVKAVIVSATGPAGSLVMTMEVRDVNDNLQPNHPPYTAAITDNSVNASIVGSPLSIPGGTSSNTFTVNDTKAEIVTLTPVETTFSGMTTTGGTATFTAGAATKVVVKNAVEAGPGTANSVTMTIEVQDANGNAIAVHPAYTATVGVTGSAAVVGSPISLPSGTASTTITVNDTAIEVVTVSLTETSGTALTEQSGTATFNGAMNVATRVVAISGTEAAPGTANTVVITFQAQDDLGNAVTLNSPYTADLFATGLATINGADNFTIGAGASATTKTITDTAAEVVSLTFIETSGSSILEVFGTATFIAGTATRVRVLPAMETGTASGASVTVTIRVEDTNGNPQSAHPAYTANLTEGDAATTLSPTSISIPNGTVSVTITATEIGNSQHITTINLTETSASGLAEVSGTVTFVNGGNGLGAQVVVLSATEAAPGTANSIVVTIQVQDSGGAPLTSHAAYTAIVDVSGFATVTGSPITIPDGASSTTVTVNNTRAETVSVNLIETSGTIFTEVNGTATFIAGPATRVHLLDVIEVYPSTSNSVVVTIRSEDANGNPAPVTSLYTATVTEGSASMTITGTPISIPAGSTFTSVTATNTGVSETTAVNLTETSATGLTEVNGTVRFDIPQGATQVVVVSAIEAAPGTSNAITMTVQVRTAAGTATTVHPAFTATILLTGSATTASTVNIPNGTSTVNITINDTKVEAVTVSLVETSTTGLTPVAGTATFIVGTAAQVVVISAAEPAPYSADSVVVTIQVRDANGNPQTNHTAYTATVSVNGSASVVGSPISIPNGTSTDTITVNDATAETVNVTLTETSGTGLTEVNGTVVFQLDPPEAVITASSNVAPTGGAIDFDGSASFAEFPFVLVSYAWDFNGDGVIDSTLADPAPWTYAAAGTYTVSLKVVDSGGYTDTSTMKVYVAGAGQPVGPITLTPSAWTMAADGTSTITISSNVLADAYGVTVPDGTKITVFTDRGALGGFADAGPEPGLQAGTVGGVITVVLTAGTTPGDAHVAAKSLTGASEGSVTIGMTGTGKAPFVVGFGPSGKATANPTQVTCVFSEEINPGTLNGFTFTLTGSLSGPVQGNVSYQPGTRTATFTIVGPMDVVAEIYTVVVSHFVLDPDGLGLDGNFNGVDDGGSDDFSFQFGALADGVAPALTSVLVAPDPFSPDQDGVEDSTTITVTVDDAVRWQARVLSGGVVVRTIVVTSGSAAAWDGRDESGAVVEEGTYTVEVTAWDGSGNASATVSSSVDVTSPLQFGSFGP